MRKRYEVRHYVTVVRDVTIDLDERPDHELPADAEDVYRNLLDSGRLGWPKVDQLAGEHIGDEGIEVGGWQLADADDEFYTDDLGPTPPARELKPRAVLDRIWDLMEEKGEWDASTIEDVASVLIRSGYPEFTDPNGVEATG